MEMIASEFKWIPCMTKHSPECPGMFSHIPVWLCIPLERLKAKGVWVSQSVRLRNVELASQLKMTSVLKYEKWAQSVTRISQKCSLLMFLIHWAKHMSKVLGLAVSFPSFFIA